VRFSSIFSVAAAAGLALGAASCSEDFDVAAPYKDVTVIYGLLNAGDTAHYIRVQKAFLDESRSALDMARTLDSNFYSSLRVQMRELNGANVVSTLPDLQRVDLTAEGFPKDSGSFFRAPSFAYKTTATLNPARIYRLVVTNTATGAVDSAETPVIDNAPGAFRALEIELIPNYRIDFSRVGSSFRINISPKPQTVAIMEATMRFHIIDRVVATGAETRRTADFALPRVGPGASEFTVGNTSIYNFLASAIGPAPNGTERLLDSPDVFIYAATQSFYDYLQYNLATGGITGDQVRPIYTNIRSATGALGLFASRIQRAYLEVPLAPVVIDSLRAQPTTANLNVVGIYGR